MAAPFWTSLQVCHALSPHNTCLTGHYYLDACSSKTSTSSDEYRPHIWRTCNTSMCAGGYLSSADTVPETNNAGVEDSIFWMLSPHRAYLQQNLYWLISWREDLITSIRTVLSCDPVPPVSVSFWWWREDSPAWSMKRHTSYLMAGETIQSISSSSVSGYPTQSSWWHRKICWWGMNRYNRLTKLGVLPSLGVTS